MTVQVRLDFRNEAITLESGEIVYKVRWYLQATNPVRDLWKSCSLFDTELEALDNFSVTSYIAGYDNFVNAASLPNPTGE